MKSIITALSFLIITIISAQQKEPLVASVIYKVSLPSYNGLVETDSCQLDISKTKSYFYSLFEKENDAALGKIIEEALKSKSNTLNLDGRKRKFQIGFNVFKNYKEKSSYVMQKGGIGDFGFYAYLKQKNTDSTWHLSTDTLSINNVLCYKAFRKVDTILVTAWYCSDIPLQDGPLSNFGLPGLILKVSTTNGITCDLLQIIYNKDTEKLFEIPKYKLTTEKEFVRYKKGEINQLKSGNTITTENGNGTIKLQKKED